MKTNAIKKAPTRNHLGHFGRLANLYYPNVSAKMASRLFRNELRLTRGLLQALLEVGYNEKQRVLTPRQVRIIESFLGEAD